MLEAREYCQARAKKEERDLTRREEAADFGEHRERWIVDDYAVCGIFGIFIIAAGEERAKDLFPLEGIDLADVSQDGFVNITGSVGVVGGFLRFPEFCDEALVVMKNYRVFAPPPHFAGPGVCLIIH